MKIYHHKRNISFYNSYHYKNNSNINITILTSVTDVPLESVTVRTLPPLTAI